MTCPETEKLARLLCEEDGLDPDAEEWIGWDPETCERLVRPLWHSRLDEARTVLRQHRALARLQGEYSGTPE